MRLLLQTPVILWACAIGFAAGLSGHTNGVGLVSADNGDGTFDVTIVFGSYHSKAPPDGALSLYDDTGAELFGQGGTLENQTFPLVAYPEIGQKNGLTNAEVDAAGFTRGVDFFGVVSSPSFGFTDDVETPLYTLSAADDILALQQVTVVNVLPGNYFADYDEDPVGATAKADLSQDWDSTGLDAASGGEGFRFTLAADGSFSFPVLNSPPVLADAGDTLAFTENQVATAIDNSLTLSDGNDTHFQSATVSISSGFQATEDVLGFADQNGITHSWDAVDGVLTLTGNATLADYEAALESVTYNNTSEVPDTSARTVSWVVHDGVARSLTLTSAITVTSVNDAPGGADKTLVVLEEGSHTFAIGDFGFMDQDGNNFSSLVINTLPGAGSLELSSVAVTAGQEILVADIGNLMFTPVANGNGSSYASFSFSVKDDGGTSDGGMDTDPTPNTITFNVTSVNDEPGGADKTMAVMEDRSHSFSQSDFGFIDPDGDSFASVFIATLPAAGHLEFSNVAVTAGQEITVGNLGNLVFIPVADANGGNYATITFSVKDDGGTSDGGVDTDPTPNRITFDVTSVNDSPAGSDKTLTVLEDDAHTFSQGDFGYTDPDGNNFASVIINTLPAAGTFELSSVAVTAGQEVVVGNLGNLVFIPAANANGSNYALFTFSVKDDGGTSDGGVDTDPIPNIITVDVTSVNDAPGGTDKTVTVLEDRSHTFSQGDFGFTDPDGNAFASVIINTLPGAGTLELSSVAVTAGQEIALGNLGNLVFMPAADANGGNYASFTFSVKDDGGTSDGGVDTDPIPNIITVDVTSVNDPPGGTDKTLTVLEDGSHTFSHEDFGFTDLDGDAFASVFINTLPGAGTLELSSVAVTAGQEIALGNLGNLVFTPVANANGSNYASFTFSVKDGGGTANGGVDTDLTPNTIMFDVTPVNDPPVLTPIGSQTTNEDTPFSITLSATDIDGDDLVFIAQNSLHIIASLSGAVLTLSPSADWFGVENITVTVSDGLGVTDSETFPVTVSPINDTPFLDTVEPQFMDEDTVLAITLSASDKEAGAILYTASSDVQEVSLAVNGDQVTFTPDVNWFGLANITVVATDPDKDTDTKAFLLTVRPVNDLPTIQDPGAQVFDEGNVHSIPLSAFDVETANPTLSATASNPGLVATIVGTTLQLIAVEWSGQAMITVSATDEEGATASVTFPVTVTPYIAPPPHRPAHTYPAEQLIDTSVPFTFSIAGGNPVQVDDPDSSYLTTTLEARYGILKLQQDSGLTFLDGTSDGSPKITVYGTLGDINAALDGLTYSSTFGFVGGDTIRLRSVDQGGLTDNDFLRLVVEVVALAGQPNLTVDTIVQPGKTIQQAYASSFDRGFLQEVTVAGVGQDMEVALLPVVKQEGNLPDHTDVGLVLEYTDGTSETITIPVVIYYVKVTLVQAIEGIAQLNRSTHLYEAIVEVENTTPYTMEAFRLYVDGLTGGAELRTLTGYDGEGNPYLQHDLPMTPGESRQFKLEFYVPGRRWVDPVTNIRLELLGEAQPESVSGVTARLGEDVQSSPDQSIYISFATEPDATYYIQYSQTPAGPWSTSPIPINGNGLYQVWVDSGPPKSVRHPKEVGARFYRILLPAD
jgi:hypothetical protein